MNRRAIKEALIISMLTSLREGIRTDNGADRTAGELPALSSSSLARRDIGNACCASI